MIAVRVNISSLLFCRIERFILQVLNRWRTHIPRVPSVQLANSVLLRHGSPSDRRKSRNKAFSQWDFHVRIVVQDK